MTQNSRLMCWLGRAVGLILVIGAAAFLDAGAPVGSPGAAAQSSVQPAPAPHRIAPYSARTPPIRAMPAPREVPKLRLSPSPRLSAEPGTGLGAGANRREYQDTNCLASCRAQCQLLSCQGISASRCASNKRRCRVGCSSRC